MVFTVKMSNDTCGVPIRFGEKLNMCSYVKKVTTALKFIESDFCSNAHLCDTPTQMPSNNPT